ncbi:MAG: 4'-phosphopantetheinyl transferase superfamily protein [Clostridia bacterium]|nr:4'-phosphopantetheinyl transferase superfamily protein [Clostridia bacterium]
MQNLPGAELLEESRRIHMQRYLKVEDRARCLAAGLMLRTVLGRDRTALVQRSHLGKPYLPGGICFNLSHSGSKVVLAVDEAEVGIDIEQITPWSTAVARQVFTADEQKWLLRQSTDAAFYRLWTGKEAIMKALGLGFQLPPESFEILPDSIGPNPVCGRGWFLHWQEIDGHMICTASERAQAPEAIVSLTRERLLAY